MPREAGVSGRVTFWLSFVMPRLFTISFCFLEYPIELRRAVRKELADLLVRTEDDTQLRSFLNDGLGVNVYFKKPAESRAFAQEVERKLLSSIQTYFDQRRRS